jgi:gliding motility-associated-like protein
MAYYYIDDVFVVEIENDCPENIDDSVNPVIPDIFTPNKDGYNDEFVMLNLFDNTQLTIYNRWGTVIYQSNNYQNNWDGGTCTDGVYYYILNTADGKQYKGTLTILR